MENGTNMNINNIKLNPDNPRTLSEDNFNKLIEKIRRNPDGLDANKIVHKDGVIIAGNQRFRVLKKLRDEIEIKDSWFKDVSGWTDEQVREYLVISNISDGEWDFDKLAEQFEAPELEELGLNIPNFDEDFSDKNKEIDTDELGKDLDIECPKCGFKFKENV